MWFIGDGNPYGMRNGYRFNSGKKSMKYIQVLNILMYSQKLHASSIKRFAVHRIMGWPECDGNRSAMWAELNRVGYAEYCSRDRAWHITDKGINFLRDNELLMSYEELCTAVKDRSTVRQLFS